MPLSPTIIPNLQRTATSVGMLVLPSLMDFSGIVTWALLGNRMKVNMGRLPMRNQLCQFYKPLDLLLYSMP